MGRNVEYTHTKNNNKIHLSQKAEWSNLIHISLSAIMRRFCLVAPRNQSSKNHIPIKYFKQLSKNIREKKEESHKIMIMMRNFIEIKFVEPFFNFLK